MQKLIGLIVVLGCVIGGYMMSGGHIASFWQPGELIIILGAGAGAMVIANPKH
ncbi:motility-associated protein, partial [Erwinia sp. MYb416]